MATVIWDGPLGVAVLTNVYDPQKAKVKRRWKRRKSSKKQVIAKVLTMNTFYWLAYYFVNSINATCYTNADSINFRTWESCWVNKWKSYLLRWKLSLLLLMVSLIYVSFYYIAAHTQTEALITLCIVTCVPAPYTNWSINNLVYCNLCPCKYQQQCAVDC